MSDFEKVARAVKESWRLMDEHRRHFILVWRREGTRAYQVEVPRCQVMDGGRQCYRELGHNNWLHREVSPKFVEAFKQGRPPLGIWQKFRAWLGS